MRQRVYAFAGAMMGVLACAFAGADPDGGLGALTRQQSYESKRVSSVNPDFNKNNDARSIEPGATLVLGELEGPGVITHIWCTVGAKDPFYGRSLVLRFYWDGAEKPSVEVPLGDFFAAGHGMFADVTSAPVVVTAAGRSRNCFWRMPFHKAAKVTVTNDSSTHKVDSFYYCIDWRRHESLPEDTAYFHAQYRQATPAAPGDYTLLETQGRGHYVGTVYSVQQMEIGWFGEGDDRFYIDGEEKPSLQGTGTEDYFCDAWGFRQFCTPYYGVPMWEGYFAGDRVTAYRWHIQDPITFRKSLRVDIEHKGSIFTPFAQFLGQFIERSDWISSVAFWYQTPVAFSPGIPPLAERLPPYAILAPSKLTVRAVPDSGIEKGASGVGYLPMKAEAQIEFDFETPTDGTYQINALMGYALIGGVYQAFLDGKALGAPIDFFVSGEETRWINFDLHRLHPGVHTLRFVCCGLSPNARTLAPEVYALGIDCLALLRLEDMKGYNEAMNQEIQRQTAAPADSATENGAAPAASSTE
ncbi:MAG TPA: DUF2961 domain-containing protein [Candidatus Hydrogenedentes bacterium]|nr:DUF2961 domain-containing protein [Candidatus Hydrogenedentota bacterium]HOS02719.1 DUF2961 domain-containing protein [Candidatus Hydrogenedentota bacterium]